MPRAPGDPGKRSGALLSHCMLLAVAAFAGPGCKNQHLESGPQLMHRIELIRTINGGVEHGTFTVFVSPTSGAEAVRLQTPAGKLLELTGSMVPGEFLWRRPWAEFNRLITQGEYLLLIMPATKGEVRSAVPQLELREELQVSVAYPAYARIESPAAGATGVSRSPAIRWSENDTIKAIDVSLRDASTGKFLLEMNVGNKGNHVPLSGRILAPNTTYEISLEVRAKDGIHFSQIIQNFTTGND